MRPTQTATIENGFVHLPEIAHWLADFIHELTQFPADRYDEQVDSTAQALAWTKQRPALSGFLDFYQAMSEAAAGKRPPPLVSPVGR
jgi:hypothetical protein